MDQIDKIENTITEMHLNQMNLTDIYRTFHPTVVQYAFFISVYTPFSRMNHMLKYKTRASVTAQ